MKLTIFKPGFASLSISIILLIIFTYSNTPNVYNYSMESGTLNQNTAYFIFILMFLIFYLASSLFVYEVHQITITKELLEFVKEAKRRGFSDLQIKQPLIKQGWPKDEVERAIKFIERYEYKNQVTVYLEDKLMQELKKRAKKNMFSLSEQIEDILRRSALNSKSRTPKQEKLDDMLVGLFSRKKR